MPTRPERRLLGEQAVEAILQLIAETDTKPGERLPSETQLADDFAVSRPVIREALRTLSERGVVEIVNGRGAVVRPLDSRPLRNFFARAVVERPEAVTELMEVRRGIEVQAAQLAATRRTTAQLTQMRDTVAAMRAALAVGVDDEYIELDTRFHLELADATGNLLITHLMTSIRDMLQASIDDGFRSRTSRRARERAHAHHDALLDALQRGDADAAGEAMVAHFEDALASLKAARRQGPARRVRGRSRP